MNQTLNINGWVIYNGCLPGDKFIDFATMFSEAAKKIQIETTIFKNNELLSLLHTDGLQVLMQDNEKSPDFVIMTDKDLNLARQLELLNIPVFNSSRAIEISDDKIHTHQILATRGIPSPKTIISPLVYFGTQAINNYLLNQVIEQLGFPMIVKEAFGSFGEQVYLIESRDELINKILEIGDKPFFFQEFVKSSYGRDVRLQVVGDEVVAAMKRTAVNDFRANVTNGGKMNSYTPNDAEKKIAVQALQAIGANFGGVDLLYGVGEQPIVCEVNSNAHIRNLYDCTGINSADYIIKYIKDCIAKEKNL